MKAHAISQDEYNQKIYRGEALISFLGFNGFPKIDLNAHPFKLQSNDRIVLMSDGLYKLVDNETMGRVIGNFNNISEAAQALEIKAKNISKNRNVKRDNMTVAIIRVK